MILEDGDYALDTEKLGKIEFPFYNAFGRCGYYLPADKSIYVPIRFKFAKDGKLCASIKMADSTMIRARAKIDLHDLLSAMENAYENETSLFQQPVLTRCMQPLADAVYRQLGEMSEDLLLQDQEQHYPAFLLQHGKLIAISKHMKFSLEEDGRLSMKLIGAKGPFLRSFESEEDMKTEIVMLNADGMSVLLAAGTTVNKVSGNDISLVKEKDRMPKKELADKCIDIYQQYKDNLMNYFLDQEETEGGSDFELEDFFKAGK